MPDDTLIEKLAGKVDTLTTSVVELKGEIKAFPRVVGLAVGEAAVEHIKAYHQKTSTHPPRFSRSDLTAVVKYALYVIGLLGSCLAGKELL